MSVGSASFFAARMPGGRHGKYLLLYITLSEARVTLGDAVNRQRQRATVGSIVIGHGPKRT